ncbi:hypothetical protein MKZ20_08135 [Psychrobacillus sp. FSL K6-2684]|uniref:hypothetical protein n=1 Tax=Psychrobacillus sp. FSL K6-2684 TaxID=2921547 RepID=UPI0030F84363
MVPSILNQIFYVVSILFLVLSFLSATFFNEDFTFKSLLNTDGLTLIGIIFSLTTLILQKIPLFRRLIIFVLLRFNYLQLDYRLEVSVVTQKKYEVEDIWGFFEESVINFEKYKTNDYKFSYTSNNKIHSFHRAVGGNVHIEKTTNNNNWTISIDGTSSYRILERNINFVINTYLEIMSKEQITSDKISLIISKNNTEYDLEKIGVLLSSKNYKMSHTNIEIECNTDTLITINSNYGITMTSKNKGDFSNSLEALKSILIS